MNRFNSHNFSQFNLMRTNDAELLTEDTPIVRKIAKRSSSLTTTPLTIKEVRLYPNDCGDGTNSLSFGEKYCEQRRYVQSDSGTEFDYNKYRRAEAVKFVAGDSDYEFNKRKTENCKPEWLLEGKESSFDCETSSESSVSAKGEFEQRCCKDSDAHLKTEVTGETFCSENSKLPPRSRNLISGNKGRRCIKEILFTENIPITDKSFSVLTAHNIPQIKIVKSILKNSLNKEQRHSTPEIKKVRFNLGTPSSSSLSSCRRGLRQPQGETCNKVKHTISSSSSNANIPQRENTSHSDTIPVKMGNILPQHSVKVHSPDNGKILFPTKSKTSQNNVPEGFLKNHSQSVSNSKHRNMVSKSNVNYINLGITTENDNLELNESPEINSNVKIKESKTDPSSVICHQICGSPVTKNITDPPNSFKETHNQLTTQDCEREIIEDNNRLIYHTNVPGDHITISTNEVVLNGIQSELTSNERKTVLQSNEMGYNKSNPEKASLSKDNKTSECWGKIPSNESITLSDSTVTNVSCLTVQDDLDSYNEFEKITLASTEGVNTNALEKKEQVGLYSTAQQLKDKSPLESNIEKIAVLLEQLNIKMDKITNKTVNSNEEELHTSTTEETDDDHDNFKGISNHNEKNKLNFQFRNTFQEREEKKQDSQYNSENNNVQFKTDTAMQTDVSNEIAINGSTQKVWTENEIERIGYAQYCKLGDQMLIRLINENQRIQQQIMTGKSETTSGELRVQFNRNKSCQNENAKEMRFPINKTEVQKILQDLKQKITTVKLTSPSMYERKSRKIHKAQPQGTFRNASQSIQRSLNTFFKRIAKYIPSKHSKCTLPKPQKSKESDATKSLVNFINILFPFCNPGDYSSDIGLSTNLSHDKSMDFGMSTNSCTTSFTEDTYSSGKQQHYNTWPHIRRTKYPNGMIYFGPLIKMPEPEQDLSMFLNSEEIRNFSEYGRIKVHSRSAINCSEISGVQMSIETLYDQINCNGEESLSNIMINSTVNQ